MNAAERSSLIRFLAAHPSYRAWIGDRDPSEEAVQIHVIEQASIWPDEIRDAAHADHAEHRFADHFVNLPYAPGRDFEIPPGKDAVSAMTGEGVHRRVAQAMLLIRDPQSKPERRAIETAWLLHLLADLHQPLHSTALYSKEFPKGDRGGNDQVVALKAHLIAPPRADGKPLRLPNLHAFWDDLLGNLKSPDAFAKSAGELMSGGSAALREKANGPIAVEAWIRESHDLAIRAAYLEGTLNSLPLKESQDALSRGDSIEVPTLPEGYAERARIIARERILLAGLRTARVLREVLPK